MLGDVTGLNLNHSYVVLRRVNNPRKKEFKRTVVIILQDAVDSIKIFRNQDTGVLVLEKELGTSHPCEYVLHLRRRCAGQVPLIGRNVADDRQQRRIDRFEFAFASHEDGMEGLSWCQYHDIYNISKALTQIKKSVYDP